MLNPILPEVALCAEHHFMGKSYFFASIPLGDLHHTQRARVNPDWGVYRFVMQGPKFPL
jgi:hypothetical protein